MSASDRQDPSDPPETAVIVSLRRCDPAPPGGTPDEQKEMAACRAYAERQGQQVIDELILPICPENATHPDHRAAERAVIRALVRLLAEAGRCAVLLTPVAGDLWPEALKRDIVRLLARAGAVIVVLVDGHLRTVALEQQFDAIFARDELRHQNELLNVRSEGRIERAAPRAGGPADQVLLNKLGDSAASDSLAFRARSAGPAGGGFEPPHPRSPVAGRTDPLPHDGLFVRRNNAFGTRPALGIAEMIEQGVLIDQTQIRFDDFIASNTDHIPAPGPEAGVAVSHGATAVTGPFKTHPETTHLIEIALRAGREAPAGQEAGEPLPVNFVFAVDVSGSMHGEKLDDVMVAIRELHAQLRDSDVLGIIVFNDQAKTLLRSTRKAGLTADELGRLVGSLRAGGGTDLNLGLAFALDEIERFAAPDSVNCVYLFSDGDPTSGERDWVKIRANVASRVRGDVTLSCFGFGSDARIPELRALAGISGGHWTFVTESADVKLTLSEDLARRESLAALNIQLRLDIPEDTTIWHIYGHDLITDPAGRTAVLAEADAARRRSRTEYDVKNLPDLITDERGIRIFAPDLAYGETYWVVLELQAPAEPSGSAFGTATVQYLDTLARDNRKIEIDLSEPGAIPAETVLTHGVGLWTSEVAFYALDDLYENDRESAKKRLNQHAMALMAAYAEVPSPQFRDDRITLGKLLSLAGNLGTRRSWQDRADGGQFGYVVFAMNQFGRVRGGYLSQRGPAAF
jgi:uncharacterized protein YegL